MVSESKINGGHGEVMEEETAAPPPPPPLQSPPQNETQKNSSFLSSSSGLISSIRRQPSSIYSLTLEEFRHTLFDNAKNLGSMNIDEFLTNIFTSEDNDASFLSLEYHNKIPQNPSPTETKILTQLPATLSLKTVEEIWSEIYYPSVVPNDNNNNTANPGTTQTQSTFGEMTLEDFLVKAGVVREVCGSSSEKWVHSHPPEPSVPTPSQHCQLYQDPKFKIGSIVDYGLPDNQGSGGNGHVLGGIRGYTTFPRVGGPVGGGMGKGSGCGAEQMLSDPPPRGGMGTSHQQGNKPANQTDHQYELEMGGTRGRKRTSMDGPVEKVVVVERRQRRMIKNREAASRSRARKQAYTVELEAALDQLKEENARLNRTLLQEMKAACGKVPRPLAKNKMAITTLTAQNKLKMLRRMWSLPLLAAIAASSGLK